MGLNTIRTGYAITDRRQSRAERVEIMMRKEYQIMQQNEGGFCRKHYSDIWSYRRMVFVDCKFSARREVLGRPTALTYQQ